MLGTSKTPAEALRSLVQPSKVALTPLLSASSVEGQCWKD